MIIPLDIHLSNKLQNWKNYRIGQLNLIQFYFISFKLVIYIIRKVTLASNYSLWYFREIIILPDIQYLYK